MFSNSSEDVENICVVCFKNVEIFSIGCCDHMVCYECSTRMRVLCRQNECPICRQDLPKVIFTNIVKPFSEIQNCSTLEDKKFKICFLSRKIQDAFYKLLEHCCSVCSSNPSFKTFKALYDHMIKEHNLYYCDLCVEHLKIFTSERQCYTPKNLSQHEKKGDIDDRSHRGHPLCQFCDVRFMDNDCLYRHLRRDHLYCHFCDADGFDLYYSSYEYLRDHFRTEHYLCEEGSCIDEKFTPVFRTDIDLKAHRASAHGKYLGKVAAKQARTLELEFTLKPRARILHTSRRGRPLQSEEGFFEEAVGGVPESTSQASLPKLDSSQFPSLPSGTSSAAAALPPLGGRSSGLTVHAFGKRNAPLALTDENFPVLGVSNDNSVPGTSVKLNVTHDKGVISKVGGGPSRNSSNHLNHKSKGEQKHKSRNDEVSTVSSSKTSQTNGMTTKWATISNKKSETPSSSSSGASKTRKLNCTEDFPSLNSKFNTNLNLRELDASKPNFVNIKTYKNNKSQESKEKKAISVQNNHSETLEMSTALNSTKTKSKKKKSKGNCIEEKSDTAKKKNSKDEESKSEKKSENHEKSDKKSHNSALSLSNSGTTQLAKPLPKAEDWFGDLKKSSKSSRKGEDEEFHEFNLLSAEVSSSSNTNFPTSKNFNCNEPSQSNINKSASAKDIIKNMETKAPPGFDSFIKCFNNNNVKKPPPGFSTDFSLPNGLGFANSYGQSFSISAGFEYVPPANFEKRNQKLVSKVNKIISNEAILDQFRKKSMLFRQNLLTAKEYYEHCVKIMGIKGLEEVFPELLILLPEINKQQELYQVYSQSPNFPKNNTLEVCVTCYQVLSSFDAEQHFFNHTIEQNFPTPSTNHWTK